MTQLGGGGKKDSGGVFFLFRGKGSREWGRGRGGLVMKREKP